MPRDTKEYRILVVEDNLGDFVIVEDFLMEQIYSPVISHAVNFKQASEILLKSAFDIILLDLTLPDKNNQDLIDEMLKIAGLSPIIILTGYTDIDFSIRSIGRGILDYLLKDDLTDSMLYKSIIYAIERKKTITNLKESEKRYIDLFQLSPQPMWVFDPVTYKFTQVNKAAIELYGYSEEEFMNMILMNLKPAEDIPQSKESISQLNSTGGFFKNVYRHYKKSGELIEVEIYSTLIKINNRSLISAIVIDVTEKNLYEHKITKAIIKTQEDERYEIGAELHDNVCQILATSQLKLGMLKGSLPQERIQDFNQCKEYITMALKEIRDLSHRLAPAFFDDSTLEEAFNRLLDSFNVGKKYKALLSFDEAGKVYRVSIEIQLNLYRILQEQLRNIVKYAKATVIKVDVSIDGNKLRMMISDNGIGFNINTVKKGIGLANIKRRAELFAGTFEINSSPGNGCAIIIDIPLGA